MWIPSLPIFPCHRHEEKIGQLESLAFPVHWILHPESLLKMPKNKANSDLKATSVTVAFGRPRTVEVVDPVNSGSDYEVDG